MEMIIYRNIKGKLSDSRLHVFSLYSYPPIPEIGKWYALMYLPEGPTDEPE